MKSLRFMLSVVVLTSLSTAAFAQSDAQEPSTKAAPAQAQISPEKGAPTEVQQGFAQMKTLAGSWEGPAIYNDQPVGPVHVTMRVTSRGNALVHEMQRANTPLDPSKYDHPVTMFYVDADQLNLLHYCDAGNRPRMTGKISPDNKSVEFEFADLSGGNERGHMHHGVFTFVDANHHIEDWTYMSPGGKAIHGYLDLHRVD